MRLAIWDIEPCARFRSLESHGHDVVFVDPVDAARLLTAGQVDVALVPVVDILKLVDAFSVIPGLSLASTVRSPWAGVIPIADLDKIRTFESLAANGSLGDICEIILRETYELEASSRVVTAYSTNGASPDAVFIFGDGAVDAEQTTTLDVGQEWYELTGTPLVWGLFAIRPGQDPSEVLDALAPVAGGGSPSDNVRFDLDVEVVDGLDRLAHMLFYYSKVDDVPNPRFATGNGAGFSAS